MWETRCLPRQRSRAVDDKAVYLILWLFEYERQVSVASIIVPKCSGEDPMKSDQYWRAALGELEIQMSQASFTHGSVTPSSLLMRTTCLLSE